MEDEMVRRLPAAKVTGVGSDAAPRTYGWLRTSASLAGVVALIVLLAWGYRLVTGTGGRLSTGLRARHPGLIEVLSRANLAPRQALYLVRVGPRLVLIGATHDALRALSVIDDPDLVARLAGQPARRDDPRRAAPFQHCLDAETGAYEDERENDRHESGAASADGLSGRLAHAVRRLRHAARAT